MVSNSVRGRNFTNHKSKMQWQLIITSSAAHRQGCTGPAASASRDLLPFVGRVLAPGTALRRCVEYGLGDPFHFEVSLVYGLLLSAIFMACCRSSAVWTKGIFFNLRLVNVFPPAPYFILNISVYISLPPTRSDLFVCTYCLHSRWDILGPVFSQNSALMWKYYLHNA